MKTGDVLRHFQRLKLTQIAGVLEKLRGQAGRVLPTAGGAAQPIVARFLEAHSLRSQKNMQKGTHGHQVGTLFGRWNRREWSQHGESDRTKRITLFGCGDLPVSLHCSQTAGQKRRRPFFDFSTYCTGVWVRKV